MKISIGNLDQSVTEEELSKLFETIGEISSLTIKRDKKTRASLGYGSVEMEDSIAEKAISTLNGKELHGKAIVLVDSNQLKKESSESDKNTDKAAAGSKIHNSKNPSNFGGNSMNRRSGGGGRGK